MALSRQKTDFRLKSSYWIVDEKNRIIIGNGRAAIMEAIRATGSINQTAKYMKMSYKTVWEKLRATEKHLGRKIVLSDRAEGTKLTAFGKKLLEDFKLLRQRCMNSDDLIFGEMYKKG